MKKAFQATTIAILFASSAAVAADLPSRKAPPNFAPPPPTFVWSGPYVGVDIGYGFGQQSGFDGVVGGGQIGYNLQVTPLFVVGLEGDFQGSDISNRNNGFFDPRRRVEWFGTVRGRAGVTPFGAPLLFYGTGGFAYGRTQSNFAIGETQTGWTAGGGAEWAFHPNISAKIEYLYTDIGDDAGGWFATSQRTRFHTVRAGVNYHFDLFTPTAITAKY